ncbi:hypothetical protein RND81_13G037900 [Saponaria officinalis]|uniref:Reverse transcriptase zinc-binding domain-containing protein n=1 Tax=Saponaria officinalis TaxID=3572 RepID=A0AAW1GVS4_SAPOF
MQLGSLPFKYLGVPIPARKLSVLDCSLLVERIVERIRALGSRHLSYGGRLTLIKSVLANLHSYWARIFILPKAILKRIDDICRNFLWKGLKRLHEFNIASVAKYVWWLANKKDHLWVRWVNGIYFKGSSWASVQASASSSWAWKRICKVRDIMLPGYQGDWWLQPGGHYSVNLGYKWLCPDGVDVQWRHVVWNRFCLPRHSFICWVQAYQRLQTRARMAKYGYNGDMCCCLCAEVTETAEHLFFKCKYSTLCVQYMSNWLGFHLPSDDTWNWWMKHRFKSLFLKKVIGAAIVGLVFSVWKARNHSLHNHVLIRPDVWMKPVVANLIYRCQTQISSNVRERFEVWLSTLS